MRPTRWILLLLFAVACLHAGIYYDLVPERPASLFDSTGRPVGSQTKLVFFGMYVGLAALVTFLFLALEPFLRRLPDSWINLPHKEYWLAPERRSLTFREFGERLERFAIATMLLLIIAFHLAFRANLSPTGSLNSLLMWVLLVAYFVYSLVVVVQMLGFFERRDATGDELC